MHKTIFTIFVFGSVFAYGVVTDAYILPKWLFFAFICCLYAPFLVMNGTTRMDKRFVSLIFSFVVLLLCTMCFCGQFYSCKWDTQNAPIATYDNVAGVMACLCPMIAYVVYGFGGKLKIIKQISVPLILFCILNLKSRTGILSATLPLMLYIFLNSELSAKTNKRSKWSLLFYLVITMILITLSKGKTDSAKGRILVWNVTLQMLPDALPFGFGHGGFERNYMNYQASYFGQHTDSTYAMLADNTSTPFNEYLHLIVDYGLIGIIVFVTLGRNRQTLWSAYSR